MEGSKRAQGALEAIVWSHVDTPLSLSVHSVLTDLVPGSFDMCLLGFLMRQRHSITMLRSPTGTGVLARKSRVSKGGVSTAGSW